MSLDLPALLHELGRGARGARALSRADAHALFAAMLADENAPERIGDLELGGLLIAYRIKGETADELAGMLEACDARLRHIAAPSRLPTPVVIPSYNGARKLPNLTPLLALALAQRGVPVLVHGDAADAYGRISSASVFAALGVAACRDVADIELALHTRRLAFAPIEVLSPPLARLIALRQRLGVRGPAHTLVKLIQPFAAPALRLVNYTHPQYRDAMAELFLDARIAGEAGVLLARGSEGEAVADPRRQVAIEWLRGGTATTQVEAVSGTSALPELPDTRDAATTARWIERALAGAVALPAPLARQIEAICAICIREQEREATTPRKEWS
ncbi:MAG: DNA-binding protein YbiB [Gammaproteobacteria bacterium]|nr:MAG: DNA-binding protein YbiB [Gammaproteobacteria bacterium]